MCYHVKFGRSASKDVRINRRNPKKLGVLGPRLRAVGVWLIPYKYAPLPHVLLAEFGRFKSNGTSDVKESCLKNLTPCVPRKFKVIQGQWN